MLKTRPRTQKGIRGRQRIKATNAFLLPEIDKSLTLTATRFKISKSFVVSIILADFFGIDEQERLDNPKSVKAKQLNGKHQNLSSRSIGITIGNERAQVSVRTKRSNNRINMD